MPDKRSFKVGKEIYDIDATEADAFLADMPDAKEVKSFIVGKDTFDIPLNEVDDFVSSMPDAKPIYQSDLKKKEQTDSFAGARTLGQALPEVSVGKKTATPSPLKPSVTTSKSGVGKPVEKVDVMREKLAAMQERNANTKARIEKKKQLNVFEQNIKANQPVYEQELAKLKAISEDVNQTTETRKKAINQANKLIQDTNKMLSDYEALVSDYNTNVEKDKQYVSSLVAKEKQLKAFDDKEYSTFQNFVESTGKHFVDAAAGIADVFNVLGLSGDTEGGGGYDRTEVKRQTRQNIQKIRDFGESLVTQQKPEEYQSLFKGKLSAGKILDFTLEAVASTVPTVAAGLITGGAGGAMAGSGMMFGESKDILKSTGLSEEQSEWGALGLSIPLGLLERYGVEDVVAAFRKSGALQTAAGEFAKKVAGKQLTKQQLFEAAKQTMGEVIKKEAPIIFTTGLKESGTEIAQGEVNEIAKQVAQEITGQDEDEGMPTFDYVKEQLLARAEEGIGGFLGGVALQLPASAIGNARRNPITETTYQRAVEYRTPELMQEFQQELQKEVEAGVLTAEQAEQAVANITAIQTVDAMIPANVSDIEARTQAVNLLMEKQALTAEVEGKDEALVAPQTERIADIDKKLSQISKTNQEVEDIDEAIAELEKLKVPTDEKAQTEEAQTSVLDSEAAPDANQQPTAETTSTEVENINPPMVENTVANESGVTATPVSQENVSLTNEENKLETPVNKGVEVSENPALRDVESTAKALEGKNKEVPNILVPNSSIKQKVYHGSENKIVGDFKNLNPNIDGFFFSSDIDNAKTYGKNVVEAHVDVKNPLVIDAKGLKFTDDMPVTVIASYPNEAPYETVVNLPIDEIAYLVKNGKRKNQLIEIKDREKYDGIVFKNLIDPALSSRRKVPQDTIVVFDNSQIKRADNKSVSEAYHKAKADGSNPELVKAVESLLSKEQTPDNKDLATQEKGEAQDGKIENQGQNQDQVLSPKEVEAGGKGQVSKPDRVPPAKPKLSEGAKADIAEAEKEIASLDKKLKKGEITKKLHKQLVNMQREAIRKAKGLPPRKYNVQNLVKGVRFANKMQAMQRTDWYETIPLEKRIAMESFGLLDPNTKDIKDNIREAELKLLIQAGLFAKEGGISLNQYVIDEVSDTGLDQETITNAILEEYSLIDPQNIDAYFSAIEETYDVDEQMRRYNEEAEIAQKEAEKLEAEQRQLAVEEADISFELIEDYVAGLTEEQVAELEAVMAADNQELSNQIINEYEQSTQQDIGTPDTETAQGETGIVDEESQNERNRQEFEQQKARLQERVDEAQKAVNIAEADLKKAKQSYQKAVNENQIDLTGRAKANELLFTTNLSALNKRVKEKQDALETAKADLEKAKTDLDNLVPPNQGQLFEDNFLRDENGNILFEPKIEYEQTIETKTEGIGQLQFTSFAANGNITSESNVREAEGEAYNPNPEIKSVTWVERVLEQTKRFDFTGPNKIKSSADVAFLFRHLESAVSENVFAVLIDKSGKYKVVYVSTGATTAAISDPKPIISAIQEYGAESIVLVHNHPSGRLEPSQADRQLHSKLSATMDAIGVQIHDSVIINLDTGKYVEFNTNEQGVSSRNTEQDYKKLVKPKVYEFSKQVLYDQSWTKQKITSSRDAAEFLSRQKRGAVPKVGLMILDRANNVNRYVLADPKSNAKELTKTIVQEIAKHGESVIISTNSDIAKSDIEYIKKTLSSADMTLLDIVVTQQDPSITSSYKSYADEGLIYEPQAKYGEDKILSTIDKLKLDTDNTLNAFGLIPAAWNATIDVVKAAYSTSKNIADAIEKGLEYARKWAKDNNAKFDESGAKAALEKAFKATSKQPSGGLASQESKTPADLKKPAQAIEDMKLEYFKEVKDALRRIGVNIAEGYLSKRVYGIYKYNPKKIRVQSLWKIGTVTHEVAHWVSDNFGIGKALRSKDAVASGNPNAATNKKLRKELTRAYVEFYPNAKPQHTLRLRVEEGIAVLLQHYFYNPNDIAARYPELVKEFLTPGGLYYNEKFSQTLDEMNGLMGKFSQLTAQEQIGARVARGKELLRDDKLRFTWGQKLTYEVFKGDEILRVIDELAGSAMTDASAEIAHRRWQTRGHIASNWIRGQQKPMTVDKNGDWKPLEYSMKDMAKEIKGKEKEFDYYLVARRAVGDINRLTELENEMGNLMQSFDPTTASKEEIEEIENLQKSIDRQRQVVSNDDFDLQTATDVINKFEKEFEKATEIFDYMNNEAAKFAYHTGLISKEKLDNYLDNPTYAAFRRLINDDMGTGDPSLGGGSQKSKVASFKSRSGSQKQIISPVYSQMFHITETINKGMQNQIWTKLADIAKSDSFVADNYFEKVETQVSVDPKTSAVSYPQLSDKNLVPVWKNGKPTFYKASKELLAMAEIMQPQELHMALFFARRAAALFARLTTSANPLFPLVNMPVDTISAWMNTKTGFVPVLSQLKTLPQMGEYLLQHIGMAEKAARLFDKIRNKPIRTLDPKDIKLFEKYLALGGSTQTLAGYLDMTPDEVLKAIRNENNIVKATKWIEDHTLGLMEIPSNMSEYMTRFAEFKRAKEQGDSDDVAMWKASEVSVPFIQQGNLGGRFGRDLVRTIPYFNASLQVLGKMYRAAKDDPARVALVVGGMAAIQIGLAIATVMDADDEDLQLLAKQDPERLSKFIYIPNALYGGKGFTTLRVPEQIGWIGATALMAMMELRTKYGYDFKDYINAGTAGLPQQFKVWEPDRALMAYTPQIVRPSIETITNTKTYPDIEPVVPYGLSTKLPEYQYTQYTSEVAKMAGKYFKASPMLIDNFVKNQFGKVPAMIIDATESVVFDKKMKMSKVPTNLQAEEFALRGREMNKFYENLQYWNRFNRSYNDMEASGGYSEEDLTNLDASYILYDGVNSIISDFREISNKGVEIPFAYRDKLFDVIQKLNNTTEPYKYQEDVRELEEMTSEWINSNL